MHDQRRCRWMSGRALALRCRAIAGLALLLLAGGTVAPAGAQIIVGRGFGESFVGFQDVNGNGVLDCLEPVTIRAAYVDPAADTATGSITGQMVAPFAGASGLAFIPGSVELDRVFSVGDCVAAIVTGNDASDVEATVSFSCGPPRNNGPGAQGGNVVAFLYRAFFRSTVPSFTAAMRGTTSDGLDLRPQLTQSSGIGAVCSAGGGTPSVTVQKTVAGTGLPGSTLLYTISATDLSGLGLGGVQLTDEVPQNTVFDAGASSPGWVCPAPPGAGAGSLCRLAAGNIDPNGTVTRFFAVDIVPTLPAGASVVSNTACARSGPSTVVGCGSVATPTAGTVSLTVAKSLAAGLPLSGVVGKAEIMDAPAPGGLGGTYAGNPVACAAGLAVLDVMRDERLPERAARIGSVVEERMHSWAKEHELIGDVRVMGAMAGMELVRNRETKEPADKETARILAVAREKGLILLRSGVHHNVIRTLMPLTIPDAQLDEGLDILGEALAEVAAAVPL